VADGIIVTWTVTLASSGIASGDIATAINQRNGRSQMATVTLGRQPSR
jgi:hypothetical protein